VHNSYHSGVNRARLIAANGNADNQVIVTVASTGTLGGDTGSSTSPLAIAVTAAVRIDIDELVECVSNFGFGPPPIGLGQIVKVVLPK
jgi:hypothetical protein